MAQAEPGTAPDGQFDGTGDVRAAGRSIDWATTGLGPISSWPLELWLTVQVMLDSAFPMAVSWGPDHFLLYNDAYLPLLGRDKHPQSLGRPAREVFPEAWHVSDPIMEQVRRTGVAVRQDDLHMMLERDGFLEECYFIYTQSPIRDASGTVAGVFSVVAETTRHVLAERRMGAIRELAAIAATDFGSAEDVCVEALAVLSHVRESVPFAVAFLRDAPDGGLRRVAGFGLVDDACVAGLTSASGAGPGADVVDRVVQSGRPEYVSGLRADCGAAFLPGPLGELLPDEAAVVPILVSGRSTPLGAVVLGVNPYRRLDAKVRGFFQLIGRQFGIAVTDVLAYQQEHQRAQALAELNQAKSEFFQNVSHEFRTPLTLLQGPLQELLASTSVTLPERDREAVRSGVRAAQRLERLVQGLLDFARAEAGNLLPKLQRTDLARLTGDVAAMFRSAAEGTGLRFEVDLPTEPLPAAVDRGMWTTVVTNLLGNALKYTVDGSVGVRLAAVDGQATLTVTDTGIGISPDEQPRVFDRFYRAPGGDPRGGAGIGLALVADLVRALHGSVELVSVSGQGSAFSVTVPVGPADGLTGDDVPGLDTPGSDVDAMARPDGELVGAGAPGPATLAERTGAPVTEGDSGRWLLLVEDDADLRDYLTRLLTDDGWSVRAAMDAESAAAALAAAAQAAADSADSDDPAGSAPDLVLSDVMLPGDSGIDLLRRLRADPATARVPIILLTALAGPDEAGQGLAAGADDYITKPFTPAELLARVRAHHELHQLREYALSQAERRAHHLHTALASNRVIGAAIGILMRGHALTDAQGFKLLVSASQHTNRKLRDVADDVMRTGALPVSDEITATLLENARRDEPNSAA